MSSLSKTTIPSMCTPRFALHRLLLAVSLSTALLLGACQRESQQPSEEPTVDVTAEVSVQPSPPEVGRSQLIVLLTDANGQGIEGATISARGDMTHAGMVPVFGTSEETASGQYAVPFEWTMGGDWFVDLTIELDDGRTVQRTLDLTVATDQ